MGRYYVWKGRRITSCEISGGDELLTRLFPKFTLDFRKILFLFVPPLVAYLSIWFIRIIISILCMLYLGSAIWKKDKFKACINIYIVAGLVYGIMPFWPMGAWNNAVML